jgi:aryl-alcohol dehydrogenase-like predicted oxidoreductase
LVIAWVLAKGKTIVPLVGARTRTQSEEAVPASAVADTRYDEHQMQMLDSER